MNEVTGGSRKARARTVDCGLRLHGVPDRIVTVDLSGQLVRHVGPNWYACVMFSDGRGVCLGADDAVAAPPEHVVNWMAQTAVALNRELHSNGHWIVAWSDAQEPVILWRDGDGDIHTAVEVAAKVETIEAFGIDRVTQFAAEALAESRNRVALLELTRSQIVKRAQGERRH